jgi:DNA-3-methyladenine glycosylase
MDKLPATFFQQDDVVELSRLLLGKKIFTNFDNKLTGGLIVETEAYRAPEDRASHAYGMRRTKRNEMMYQAGGCIYVYLCYGIHHLLNIVTNLEGIPHAVLIRAIEPVAGIGTMLQRRQKQKLQRNLTAGPGAVSQALGITREENGLSLNGPHIWLEMGDKVIDSASIVASPRVGVDYAGEDAKLPWRFRIKDSKWTSTAK